MFLYFLETIGSSLGASKVYFPYGEIGGFAKTIFL
jgi:hypothetical protein